MINRFRQLWLLTRYSFWFLPALNVVAAVVLAVMLIEVHGWLPPGALDRWPQLFGAGAEGARGLLTTVASSMITVAGVVFSITLVVLSLASSQYTSRMLRNFMSDRVTQSVLGAFVGIFAYCLVVLRTIRGGDEGVFVPSVAVLVGLLLGFLGIALLIYFIHHISLSIQASHLLAAAAAETLRAIDGLFPEEAREDTEDEDSHAIGDWGTWYPVAAKRTGYVQSVDLGRLLAFAAERQTIIRMERRVGQFVVEGEPLVSVLDGAPGEDELRRLRTSYEIDRQRTIEQDAAFGVRQIVDVALKALSPGINDTTTAVMCIEQLSAILARLSKRRIESCYRGPAGEPRLITCGPSYEDFVAEAFDQIRQSASGNVAVLGGLLTALELLAGRVKSRQRRVVLLEHVRAVAELGERSVSAPRDRRALVDISTRVLESSKLGSAAGPSVPGERAGA